MDIVKIMNYYYYFHGSIGIHKLDLPGKIIKSYNYGLFGIYYNNNNNIILLLLVLVSVDDKYDNR